MNFHPNCAAIFSNTLVLYFSKVCKKHVLVLKMLTQWYEKAKFTSFKVMVTASLGVRLIDLWLVIGNDSLPSKVEGMKS